MPESTPNPFKLPTGLLAGRNPAPEAPPSEPKAPKVEKTTEPELAAPAAVVFTASDLGLTEEEFEKRNAKKSIELDMKEFVEAKTVQRPVTPVPPPPATPSIPPAKQEIPPPPPALYTGITLKLEPSMVKVGEGVRLVVIGAKPDGTNEEIQEQGLELATMACDPPGSGKFTFGVFLPEKEGTITIRTALADAGGDKLHQTHATLTVNAAASVELSNSMQNVAAPTPQVSPSAPTQLAAPAAKPLTVAEQPIEKKFFGDKPKAMTFGGTPIYPLPGTTPEPAPKPTNNVVTAMPAATPRRLWWRANWWKALLIAILAILVGAGATVGFILAAGLVDTDSPTEGTEALVAPHTSVTIVADAHVEPVAEIPVGEDPPPVPVVHPTTTRTRTEPGLTGTPGTRVTMSARTAFPISCRTGWTTRRTDDVRFNCGPGERNGANVCACDATGTVHSEP